MAKNVMENSNEKALKIIEQQYKSFIDQQDKWGITDDLYDSYLKEYKEKQAEILSQMQEHSSADEQFYLTANMMLNIAKRAKEIFLSSEIEEKRQLLGLLLQNCTIDGKKLDFTMVSPFNLIASYHDDITLRRR